MQLELASKKMLNEKSKMDDEKKNIERMQRTLESLRQDYVMSELKENNKKEANVEN